MGAKEEEDRAVSMEFVNNTCFYSICAATVAQLGHTHHKYYSMKE